MPVNPSVINLSSLNGSTGFQISGEAAYDRSGVSVSGAGDVNGDGFADLIIGANNADPNGASSGASYVVFGKASGFAANFDLSSLDGSTGFQISGEAAGDYSGFSVSGAGDINGDGFADVIIGAYRADPNGNYSGASYVVFGKASGFAANLDLSSLDGTNGFQISGEAIYDFSGVSVSGAGDVNGDGLADLIIGANGASPNGSLSGASYVVFGKASGFAANLDLSSLDGSTGFQINGEAAVDYSGRSVSGAGDVNGDGFDDLIIGAFGADPLGNLSGASYVVFGKASGFAANLNLSSLYGSTGFQISGEAADDRSGRSVSGAGDVNGDGFADLIVGAYLADPNGSASGASYVVFGKATGFAAGFSLSSLDGSSGFQIGGEAALDRSGFSVSGAGDVNGDGFADLIVGASNADPNGSDSGASYVVFGRASGFAANLDLSSLDGNTGFQISGEAALDLSGRSVSGAGDVNGDGFGDLIIGANYADPNGSLSGASYVVFGKASGFAANLNLSSLDGSTGFQISGEAADDISGRSVSGAGDVNGDGFADLIIGASGADPNGTSSGASYVVFGRATGTLNRTFTDAAEVIGGGDWDDTLNGAGGNDTMSAGAGDDLINAGTGDDTADGGTGDDEMIGGSGDDKLSGGSGNDLIKGGSGNDTLTGSTGADDLRGGSGNDIYNVDAFDTIVEAAGSGTDTIRSAASFSIADLGNIERLAFTGTAAANGTGNGLANILTGNSGLNTLDGAAGADQLIGGKGRDTLTGGTESDSFKFSAGDSGQTAAAMDIITDFAKGAVGVGDRFDFSSALAIGGSAAAATANEASINQTTGVATFNAGSGTTLADALNDIANRFTVSANSAGEFALFRVNNTGAFHVFVSDGVAGVGANDVVVQLAAITGIGSIDLTAGDLTILT